MHTPRMVPVIAVTLFMFLAAPLAAFAAKHNAHTPSGLTDQRGHTLYVESSATPDSSQTAPISVSQPAALAVATPQATTLGPNLVPNPSLETAGSGGVPQSWRKGGYGTNTRTLIYPATPAEDGSRAANVQITSYTSGDAKWYFTPVSITPGATYQFSDWSFSNVSSEVDAQITMSDGSNRYIVLAHPGVSSSYQQTSAQFTAPSGAVSATIFHVIAAVGSLTVDNYSLQQVQQSTGGGGNLVANGDFESGTTNAPTGWLKGGWGSNTRSFSYPVIGVSGSNAARVSITSYSSGDAKWYFNPISLPSGTYTYSDSYQSNIPSVIDVQYHNADGSYSYKDIAIDPAQSSFTNESIGFVVPSGIQDVTIFHLIQGVGSLTLDNVSVAAAQAQGVFQTGGVTLTFDNGWLSQYTSAIPKMDQYGFKGTFYIITHELSDYGFSGFVSKAQIQSMYADGQEIGSHTQTHPYLTSLSSSQQKQEIDGSRSDLLALNVGPINSFAYPYGDYDASIVQLVKDAGYTNARTTITGFATPASDPYQLERQVILNTTTPAQVEQWIQEAIAEKSWLILEFHQVDTGGDTYSMTPGNFNTIIDYLAQHNVPVITVQQGVNALTQ